MRPLTYDALTAELFPRLTGGIRWGLERTERLLASAGDPHRSFPVIHVGGTNGKGSVAAHIAAVLERSGRRVGLYTSPHLCTFRERVRIDGRAISETALLQAAERLWPTVRQEAPTFFEATTALAFLALAEAGVDAAVIEVGLGGRLDATNVVTPEVVVLTNVSLDHVQLLGDSIEAVAREKAGIIKRGVPVVTGEPAGPARDIFDGAAQAAGSALHTVALADLHDVAATAGGTDFTLDTTGWGELRVHTPLAGAHQAMNAALAVHALDRAQTLRPHTPDVVLEGMAAVRWQGRLQVERAGGMTWVFDVAHNVAGVEALVAALRSLSFPRPLIAVVGVLGDKDWRNMLTPLHEAVDHVILTAPPTAPAERRWDPAEALRAAPSAAAEIRLELGDALRHAHRSASERGGTVLVTGSFHTVGDALIMLGLCTDGSDVQLDRVVLA